MRLVNADSEMGGFDTATRQRRPVVVVLHQPHSTPGHIGQWLVRNGYPLDVRKPRYGDPLPETLADHAGAVIFGGPMSANDPDDFVQRETEWIGVALRERKPFLGVCLGAQMLSNHLGGRVSFHPDLYAEIGYHAVVPTERGRAICEWPSHFYQWHREGFTVPAGACLLARNDGPFPNQAMQYGTAVGVQFHPEITYAQVNRWTTNSKHRLILTGAKPRQDHLDGHFRHAVAVHRWLDAFLRPWIDGALGGETAQARAHAAS